MVLRKLGRRAAKAFRRHRKGKPEPRLPWRPVLEGLEERWVPSNVPIVVNNTNDSGPGSLRQAILDANSNPGTDTINFNISGPGPQVINLNSALPAVTDPVVLDATSQPGYTNAPLIDLDGTHVNSGSGLTLSTGAAGSVIEGLDLTHFGGSGIELDSGGNLIAGDYIGVDPTGTAAEGNSFEGIDIATGVGNTIGGTTAATRNVIAANRYDAIGITGGSADVIEGNYLGTNAAGDATLANGNNGIYVQNATDIIIGGAAPGAGNLISGNNNGIMLDTGASGVTIAGNLIGTDASGAVALGNAGNGIFLNASNDNVIGGTAAGAGNVIAASAYNAIYMPNASGNLIQGNRVGTDATGTYALANTYSGIFAPGASQNTVGGTAAGAGNVLSGNKAFGIQFDGSGASGNLIQGNRVGTNAAGTTALANGIYGVVLTGGATQNTIGGTAAGAGNLISGNAAEGVWIADAATSGNVVAGNLIGTDVTGSYVIANGGRGVALVNATGNVIGGTDPGARNVISGNFDGVYTTGTASGNLIEGNYIGTDITGKHALGNTYFGVRLEGTPNNTVGGTAAGAGNLISGNDVVGIAVVGATASGNVLQGNRIGTDVTGTVAIGNGAWGGISIQGAPGTLIGGTATGAGNLISGNATAIGVGGTTASGTLIQGNLIGTDVTGSAALGNTADGISLYDVGGTTIGGTPVGARNVISGNDLVGVRANGASGTLIQGNYIGTDATGTVAIGNGEDAIFLYESPDNTVGGTSAAARNILSGNRWKGVRITGSGASGNLIQGNYIGTDVTGSVALGNGEDGVYIESAPGNLVGGPGVGNVISGSGWDGVFINGPGASGNLVQGNFIGTDATGTRALGNAAAGVRIAAGASANVTGTNGDGVADAAEGNVIAASGWDGVTVTDLASVNNVIAGNKIGTDVTGTAALGNAGYGVAVYQARGTVIGGDIGAAEGNLIAGNKGGGVYLAGPSPLNVTGLGIVDQLVSGALPSTTATGTIAQADLYDASADGVKGDWSYDNPIPGGGGQNYAVRVAGTLQVNTAGTYSFAIGNDDGGRLRIDGADVAVDDSLHAFGEKYGQVTLSAGTHAVEWVGFQYIGAAGFELSVAAGAGNTGPVTTANGWHVVGDPNPDPGISLQGQLAVTAYYPQPVATSSVAVAGNYIGTDVTGTRALANGGAGVDVQGPGNIIGGAAVTARNVISGNAGAGVEITGAAATGNVVTNNFIGTDYSGTATLGNAGYGVLVAGGASGNQIGTAAQAPAAPVADNLALWLNADQGVTADTSGQVTAWADLSGQGHGGTAQGGGVTLVTGALNGHNALQFSGGELALAGQVLTSQQFTVMAVVTDQHTDTAFHEVFSNWTPQYGGQSVFLGTTANNPVRARFTDSIGGAGDAQHYQAGVGTVADPTRPFILTGTSSSADASVYQDLALLGDSGAPLPTRNLNTTYFVGDQGTLNSEYWQGQIAELLVYNGALDASQLQQDWAYLQAKYLGLPSNVISGNQQGGVDIGDATSSGNVVAGNYVGTDVTGTHALANQGAGVTLWSAAGNTIGGTAAAARNLLSGNAGAGITVAGPSNLVQGNYVGVDVTGNVALANGGAGVFLDNAAGATIGGTAAGAGNVLSGNAGAGVQAIGTETTATVQGNRIGLGADGVTPLGNTYGIDLSTEVGPVVIGGTTAAARNVISANAAAGIFAQAAGTLIQGNYIGTDVTGTLARGNVGIGIAIAGPDVVVGGPTATPGTGAGNVIAANGAGPAQGTGIDVTASGAAIQGNVIGTNAAGTAALGDDQDAGVWVQAADVTVGGTAAGAGNLLSGNVVGVQIGGVGAIDDVVAGNRIGTDITGTAVIANRYGVSVGEDASGATIGGTTAGARNVISGNSTDGVVLDTGAFANVVAGNLIGTDVTGTVALGNAGSGVAIEGASQNTVGGTAAGAGNVISANVFGITVNGADAYTSYNLVAGNLIGTDVTGTNALGNSQSGVEITGTLANENQVGTGDAAGRNVISGNAAYGINIEAGAIYTSVVGNYVGTDVTGTAALGNAGAGIRLAGPENFVGGEAAGEGNLISGNAGGGVLVTGSGAAGNVIAGNLIGTDVTGTAALGNTGYGVLVSAGASGTTVGGLTAADRNVISGNQSGVGIADAGSDYNQVLNNYIGTDVTGRAALGNAFTGVDVVGAPAGTVIGQPGAGNVIAANGGWGIAVGYEATATTIQANRIGTNAAGTAALANGGPYAGGVQINGSGTLLGGTDAGAGNLISGNNNLGVYVVGNDNQVAGNLIGTDVTGEAALPNAAAGDNIRGGLRIEGQGNTVGEGNVISGNAGYGIEITGATASGNVVEGNYVGVSASGTQALGNAGAGILLGQGASQNTVGGEQAGARNILAYNRYGVYVDNAAGNPILGNSIYANARGIFYSQGAPTAAPVLTAALLPGGNLTVSGSLTGAPGTTYYLEFFGGAAADLAGAQGQQFLGSADVTTDDSGTASFQVPLPLHHKTNPFLAVTATATDPAGNTSPFSGAVRTDRAPLAYAGPDQSANEGDAVAFDGSGTIDSDGDPLTYAWDFGDGSTATGVQPTHVYAEDGIYTVTLTVDDGLGGTSQATSTVTVGNAPPVFSLGGDRILSDTRHLLTTGSFSDAGDPAWAAEVDYGDGSGTEPLDTGADHVFTLDHTYARDGSYPVIVTAYDYAGVEGSASFTVSVFQQQEISTSNTAALAPGVTTATVTTAGVSATATRPADETGVLTVFVAAYTADPAIPVLTTTTDNQHVVSVFYDVLAIGATARDTVTATFDYPAGMGTAAPNLQFLDSKSGKWEAVRGSARQPGSYQVDAANHTITVTFDDTSRPQVTNLLGTVFTVSVSTPVATPAPISPPVAVAFADASPARTTFGDAARADTRAAVVSDTSAVSSSPTRAATFQSTAQLTLTLTPSQDSQVRATRSTLGNSGPLGNASPEASPSVVVTSATSVAATGTPAANANSSAASQSGGTDAPADAADAPLNDTGEGPKKPTPGVKPAAGQARPKRHVEGEQAGQRQAPTPPQDDATVDSLMHELSEFLLNGAGLLEGADSAPPATPAPRTEHQSRLDAVDSIFGGHGPRRHGHRGEHARHAAPMHALGAALLGLAWKEGRPRSKEPDRKKGHPVKR